MPGWINGEMISVAKNRAINIVNSNLKVGQRAKVKIINAKNTPKVKPIVNIDGFVNDVKNYIIIFIS